MSDYRKIIPVAAQILKKHELCNQCLGRLFSRPRHPTSNSYLGKKLRNSHPSQKCYICKDLFNSLDHFLNLMSDASLDYTFSSFSVGAIIRPSVVDRDDCIRSKYRLMGIDSVKTDITRELGKLFSRRTKKTADFLDPDLTFIINFKDDSCRLRSKSITLFGRYVKTQREITQKQKPCVNCSGKGCRACNFHGITEFDSVEGTISKFLFGKIGGTTAKFTWIGGEDKSSLVLGTGRPFFARIQNPLKRDPNLAGKKLGPIRIAKLRMVPESPKTPLKFNSLVEVRISAESDLDSKKLKKLKNLPKQLIVVYDKSGKRSEKRVISVQYKKSSHNALTLVAKIEGGLPIKRFVSGDDVSPGISKILGVSCKCLEFDFLDIEINDNN